MKFTLILAFLLTACASAAPPITEPDIEIEQGVGPAEVGYPYGPMEVRFDMQITNRWTQPIKLTRVDVRTVNPAGGPYALRSESYFVHDTIAPNETKVVSFWAKAFGYGRGPRDTEPVSLRATVHFDTPSGTYQKLLMREMQQQ